MSAPYGPLTACAEATANIAMVKYWGKRDSILNLPVADSVALCLDSFPTRVLVTQAETAQDEVIWSGRPVQPPQLGRFGRILALLRERSGLRCTTRTEVRPQLPDAVGLAGSSAAFAAFALAASAAFRVEMSERELSALARLGSGSASRSVPGGFARWHRGQQADGSDSFSERFASALHWPELRLLAVIVSRQPKPVSSTVGMIRTSRTSALFPLFADQCSRLAPEAQAAIEGRDFDRLARIAELSAQTLHGLCLTASPPILYVRQRTIELLELACDLKRSVPLFFTLDAGPNPIFVTLAPHDLSVSREILQRFPDVEILSCGVGGGVRVADPGPIRSPS